jgi:hypothetical protein
MTETFVTEGTHQLSKSEGQDFSAAKQIYLNLINQLVE